MLDTLNKPIDNVKKYRVTLLARVIDSHWIVAQLTKAIILAKAKVINMASN